MLIVNLKNEDYTRRYGFNVFGRKLIRYETRFYPLRHRSRTIYDEEGDEMLTTHELKKRKKERDFPFYTIIITEEVCENIKRNCLNNVKKKLEQYRLMTGEEHPKKAEMLKKCEEVYQSCRKKIGKKGFINFKKEF